MTGFVLVAAVAICTPGPDTALTIRNTLVGGRGNGLRTAQGSPSATLRERGVSSSAAGRDADATRSRDSRS